MNKKQLKKRVKYLEKVYDTWVNLYNARGVRLWDAEEKLAQLHRDLVQLHTILSNGLNVSDGIVNISVNDAVSWVAIGNIARIELEKILGIEPEEDDEGDPAH